MFLFLPQGDSCLQLSVHVCDIIRGYFSSEYVKLNISVLKEKQPHEDFFRSLICDDETL